MKKQSFFSIFYCILKKNESHSSSISKIIDSERRAYLNA